MIVIKCYSRFFKISHPQPVPEIFKNMESSHISTIMAALLLIKVTSLSGLSITKGPQDTTVCMNAIAKLDCGFTGANPDHVFPEWRITFRSDNGSIISDITVDGEDILSGPINGLQWLPDITSGDDTAPDSKLLVGPVNIMHNQSSYQCFFSVARSDDVISSVGTMTVVDAPLVMINVDEICTTSITISLNTYSHPACGDVTHNVTISGNVIYPDTINGSKYTIDNLHSDTLYNITVTSVYNNGSEELFTNSVRTYFGRSPNPINATSIEIETTNNSYMRVTWKAPEIDRCSLLEVEHYYVTINSSDSEIVEIISNTTTLFNEYLGDHSNITFTVNIVVVDTNGQRSNSTVTVKTLYIQNTIPNNGTVSVPPTTTDGEDCSILFMILAAVFFATSLITTIIIVILASKLCSQRRKNDDVAVPAPDQSQRQLNVDNIEMQPSPAYVSLDNKTPQLYQNI